MNEDIPDTEPPERRSVWWSLVPVIACVWCMVHVATPIFIRAISPSHDISILFRLTLAASLSWIWVTLCPEKHEVARIFFPAFMALSALISGPLEVPMFTTRCGPRRADYACIANLKQIEGAKANWGLESKVTNRPPKAAELFGATAYMARTPQCPSKGKYTIGRLDEPPTCSVAGHSLNSFP